MIDQSAEAKLQKMQTAIDQSSHLVFFGGAGVSTASGIPDFRSSKGIYMKDTGYHCRAEEILSHDFFEAHPEIFFDFYFKHLIYPQAKPNPAHQYLATLEQQGKSVMVITQNIDGLHQRAGSQNVIELHGTTLDNYCLKCGQHYSLEELERDAKGVPRCPRDQAIVRPNIVLYQESLDPMTIMSSIEAMSQADLLIVAGTSLNVYPAASFIQYFNGKTCAVINQSPIRNLPPGSFVFNDRIESVFSQLK